MRDYLKVEKTQLYQSENLIRSLIKHKNSPTCSGKWVLLCIMKLHIHKRSFNYVAL